MGIYSQNRLSFAGCDLEYDPRPGSRFSGLSGLIEFTDLLAEQMMIDGQMDRILEKDGEDDTPDAPVDVKPVDTDTKDDSGEQSEDPKKKEEDQNKKAEIKAKLAKIKEFFQKILEAIGKLIESIKEKLLEFINIDPKLVEKYSGFLKNADSLKGFEGVAGVKLTPDMLDMKKVEDVEKDIDENLQAPMNKALDEIYKGSDEAGLKAIEDEFSKACDDFIAKLKGNGENKEESAEEKAEDKEKETKKTGSVSSDEKYIPDQDTLNKIADNLSKSKEMLTTLEKSRSGAQKALREERKNGSGEGSTDADLAAYRVNIKYGKTIASVYGITLKGMLESYRVQRKIWITCGKYASLKAGKKEEGAQESYHFALDEFLNEACKCEEVESDKPEQSEESKLTGEEVKEACKDEGCKCEESESDKQEQPEEAKLTGEDVSESVDDQPTQEEESNLSGIQDLEDETVPAIGDEISNEIEETNEQTQYHYTLETMFQ